MKELLIKVGVKPALAELYAESLKAAIALHDINNKSGFLAQALFESDMLVSTEENLFYTTEKALTASFGKSVVGRKDLLKNPQGLANHEYADRNGNKNPGDGWRYRGRGLFQLTGRANYRKYGYENNPDALLEPTDACLSAAMYWVETGCDDLKDFDMTTRRINGPAMKDALKRRNLEKEIRNGMA